MVVSKIARRKLITGYLFILPAIIGMLLFVYGPMIFSIFISLCKWDMITEPVFVGFKNFKYLFNEYPLFWKSLRVTAYFALLNVPAVNIFALFLALLLNQKIKGRSLFRTIFYIPSLVPAVANAVLWMFMFNPTNGVFNKIIGLFGIAPQKWIWDEKLVIPSLVLMSAWGAGTTMVIYLASLQGVPKSLYESVDVDGGRWYHKLFYVTIPMITPIIFYNLVMSIIGSLQVFTQGYIMTKGGPNNASLFYVLLLYRSAFQDQRMGVASAMAWILFFIVAIMTAFVFKSSSFWVYYEGKEEK